MARLARPTQSILDGNALVADFADALHLAACGSALMHTFAEQGQGAPGAPLLLNS